MKRIIKNLLLCLCFCVSFSLFSVDLGGKSFFRARPQGVRAPLEVIGLQEHIHQYRECTYGSFFVMPAFHSSFRSKELAEYLFAKKSIAFSGSRFTKRGATDVLADYFGLPTDYASVVTFDPSVKNISIDVNWYYGLDTWVRGMYVRIHAPFVHTRWDLGFKESIFKPGTLNYIGGYMGPVLIERKDLLPSVEQAFRGVQRFGDMREPLKFGKIDGKQTTTQIGDIEFVWGWDAILDKQEYKHFGINGRFTIPVGTRPSGEYLFEPVVGNCHHYGLGVGLSGHYTFMQSGKNKWSVHADANFSHLFRSQQLRSFDFVKNGPGSRYMLLEELVSPEVGGLLVDGVTPQLQYGRTLVPAINKTTLKTNVRVNLQADMVVKLSYLRDKWECDFGYNLWARTKEILKRKECFDSNLWAIKGDAQIYGDTGEKSTPLSLDVVFLNATQSTATLNAGAGTGNANAAFLNLNADGPGVVTRSPNVVVNQEDTTNIANNTGLAIVDLGEVYGSKKPILLTDADICTQTAAAKGSISHTLFVHVNRNLCTGWLSFIGTGAQIEIGHGACSKTALSQWGIWVKGGTSF